MTGDELRSQGIRRITAAAGDDQIRLIDRAIKFLANQRVPFTSDDVWSMVKLDGGEVTHPNLIGGRFRYWGKKVVIYKDGGSKKSIRPNRHSSTLFTWRGV